MNKKSSTKPTQKDRPTARVELRFTQAQKDELFKRAAAANMHLTDYLRHVLFSTK
jgi:uncharacterized protein (DUF1778 family)